jgi:hypothetical protein
MQLTRFDYKPKCGEQTRIAAKVRFVDPFIPAARSANLSRFRIAAGTWEMGSADAYVFP